MGRMIFPIKNEDLQDVLKMFDNEFYFFTQYPNLVPELELKNFLLGAKKVYKIYYKDKMIGLAFYKAFNSRYVLFKFRTINHIKDWELIKAAFSEFIKVIKQDLKDLFRIETLVYGFDDYELQMVKKLGLKFEVTRRKELFKDGTFWDIFVYSCIGNEIDALIAEGDIYAR